MIEIRDLYKFYRGKTALSEVSLTFSPGEIVGIFGENGAGKTTLMKCILGLIPYVGNILLDGKQIDRSSIDRLSFATCEHSFFPEMTPSQHREFYREHFDRFNDARYKGLMEFFGLSENKKLRSFSQGQKNQFEVIMALSQGADYILMDEPFAGSDIFNREDFYRVLSGILEEHETVIISTHLIEEVSGFVGRAVLLKKGRVIADRSVAGLEEDGITLTDFIKDEYGYRSDRAFRALGRITGKEETD